MLRNVSLPKSVASCDCCCFRKRIAIILNILINDLGFSFPMMKFEESCRCDYLCGQFIDQPNKHIVRARECTVQYGVTIGQTKMVSSPQHHHTPPSQRSQIGFENRSKRTTSLPGRRPIMDSIRTRTLTTTTIHRSSDLVSTRRFPFSVASCMQWLLFIVLADQK